MTVAPSLRSRSLTRDIRWYAGCKKCGTASAVRFTIVNLEGPGRRKEGVVMKTEGLELCGSAAMRSVQATIGKVAATNATVLLRGESGVGKEVVARALHAASPRGERQLLKVNCAALPGELLESELFGHQKGAFTGAYRDKPGKFELAHRGTLMLDEIGEVPLRLQAKLLHVLQDGEFARVGGDKTVQTDVRVIAATNRDLEAAMRAGQFREDLYYRVNVIEIRIPPLRERREEIAGLTHHFLRQCNEHFGRSIDIPSETVRLFVNYSWPGNIRELENVVKRIVVLGSARSVHDEIAAKVRDEGGPSTRAVTSAPEPVRDAAMGLKEIARRAARDAERVAIGDVLDRVQWNRTKAARLLHISYKALLYKIVQCGLVSEATEPDAKGIAA
jgi:two-component system, NtrC family, response regulator AtoC